MFKQNRAGREKKRKKSAEGVRAKGRVLTICLAAMHTVFMVNLRPHMSKRSSRFGPRRSITRTLCRPS